MQLRDFAEQPIVRWPRAYLDYSFEALEPALATQLNEAAQQNRDGPTIKACGTPTLLRLLECYLRITRQSITRSTIRSGESITILSEFIGALYSPGFVEASLISRYNYVSGLNRLIEIASKAGGVANARPKIVPASCRITEEIASLKANAESRELDHEQVWLWRSWPSSNKAGKRTWHQLYVIYKTLGRDYTERFYQACDRYFAARRAHKIDGLSQFCEFVGNWPKPLHPESFNDPEFTREFIEGFCVYFFSEGHASGLKLQTLRDQWCSFAESFVKGELIPSGLFNMLPEAVPCISKTKSRGSSTHIVETPTGIVVKSKLVTPIPLHVSDPAAIEILFHRIRREFDLLLTWAKADIKDLWFRRCRAANLAPLGTIRHFQNPGHFRRVNAESERTGWPLSSDNPDYIANLAATFEHYGFVRRGDRQLASIVSEPVEQAAYELGLPTSRALLAHCTLLTATHPEITPSFLENLILYDNSGRRIGVVTDDGNTFLIGAKRRKGPSEAQQIIRLNEETASVLRQMEEITAPLRSCLKEHGDDNWRYLLLTSGRGFAYPRRIQKLATDTSPPQCVEWLAQRLSATTGIAAEEAQDLAKRFSLPSLRSSAGVLVYLETRDAKVMARALGHTTYDFRLLQHYLPEPILEYFQSRWIRLFQTAIIVEAMKDSNYLLDASGFSSMDEIDQFLQHHALRPIPTSPTEEATEPHSDATKIDEGEVVFGLSAGVLTVWLSLIQGVERSKRLVSKRAEFWRELGNELIKYIESVQSDRPDLFAYLQAARNMAKPTLMEHLIHV